MLVATVIDKNVTFEELMTIPEEDTWNYLNPNDGPVAYSSSSFVASVYRAAGLFDDNISINAAEFTVRDIYELKFFETNNKNIRPRACQEADPHVSYCQLTGEYRINLGPTFSTIKPY